MTARAFAVCLFGLPFDGPTADLRQHFEATSAYRPLFFLCRHCDRGDRYCSRTCAQRAGVSGRAMLEALAQGTTDPVVLADLARGRLRGKLPALRAALAGRFRTHHAFLVGQLLSHLDYLEEAIGTLSMEIESRLAPFSDQLSRLDSILGNQ